MSFMERANMDDESKFVLKSETHNPHAFSGPWKEECLGVDGLRYYTGDGCVFLFRAAPNSGFFEPHFKSPKSWFVLRREGPGEGESGWGAGVTSALSTGGSAKMINQVPWAVFTLPFRCQGPNLWRLRLPVEASRKNSFVILLRGLG